MLNSIVGNLVQINIGMLTDKSILLMLQLQLILILLRPYSNKAIMYIDKKTFIPVNLKVYDELGLFEAYEFYNMKINVAFAPDEFTKNFKGYGF